MSQFLPTLESTLGLGERPYRLLWRIASRRTGELGVTIFQCPHCHKQLYAKRWRVYAKRPFGGPQQVLSYLSNYTHRVASSNRRITGVDDQAQCVTFTYRDYRKGGVAKPLTLPVREFIHRFSLHILPSGLVRIRHYGILGNNRRQSARHL